MISYNTIKQKYTGNRNLVDNVLGAFVVRGLGFLISFVLFPLYLRYFNNNAVLGCWFTMYSVLTWINMFDLGIGHGLRNHLTADLSLGNYESARSHISSAYILMGGITLLVTLITLVVSRYIDWNRIFNISTEALSAEELYQGVILLLIQE